MIRQLHVRGYKSLRDVTLAMRPLRILIGPNAAGKSNVVDAFRLLFEAVRDDMEIAIMRRGDLAAVAFLGSSEKRIEIDLDVLATNPDEPSQTETLRYAVALGMAHDDLPGVVTETLQTLGPGDGSPAQTWLRVIDGHGEVTRRNGVSNQEEIDIRNPGTLALSMLSMLKAYPRLSVLRDVVNGWQFLAVDPRQIREPRGDQRAQKLTPDAGNLVNVLRTLQGSSAYLQILEDLQSLLGDVAEITTELDRGRVRLLVRERSFADPVDALALSDGTLRLLAICTALATMPDHGLLCIEEPEHGLHPLLFGPLLDTIRQRCPADGTRQVLLTTHAPDLVDVAEPREVVVVERDHHGATLLRELDEQKLERWLRDFRLGELWRMRQLGGVPE